MVNLLLDNNSFKKINSGAISHLIVCKEEGIKQGDFVFLSNSDNRNNCIVKVNYVDCEGSGVEGNYCILNVKKVKAV